MSTTADDVWRILRELAESRQETDRKFQETREPFKETVRRLKAVTSHIVRLGKGLGVIGQFGERWEIRNDPGFVAEVLR